MFLQSRFLEKMPQFWRCKNSSKNFQKISKFCKHKIWLIFYLNTKNCGHILIRFTIIAFQTEDIFIGSPCIRVFYWYIRGFDWYIIDWYIRGFDWYIRGFDWALYDIVMVKIFDLTSLSIPLPSKWCFRHIFKLNGSSAVK